MYDYAAAIQALDAHWKTILPCLAGPVVFTYIYFTSAVKQAIAEKVYVEAFFSAAFFFWHDLSFVLCWAMWFGDGPYHHWWFQSWCIALIGTVLFEAFLILQVTATGTRSCGRISRGALSAGC